VKTTNGAISPHISVVIPTRNRPDDVEQCLESLVAVAYPSWDILVVDQSTDTRTQALTESFRSRLPQLTYQRSDKTGLSRARNTGIEATHGEIVAFLDDDCTVEIDWLERGAAAFNKYPGAALVFGAVIAAPDLDLQANYLPTYDFQQERVLQGRMIRARTRGMGASMYLRRSHLRRVGPFDIHLGVGAAMFLSVEDSDYAYRCLTLGYTVVETPTVRVFHYGIRPYSSGPASRYAREHAFADAALNMKFLRCGDPTALALIVVRATDNLPFINWGNVISRRGPSGLARIAMYLRGLLASFQLDVERRCFLYVSRVDGTNDNVK